MRPGAGNLLKARDDVSQMASVAYQLPAVTERIRSIRTGKMASMELYHLLIRGFDTHTMVIAKK